MSLSAFIISGRLYLICGKNNNIYFGCEGSVIIGIIFSGITLFNFIDENKKIFKGSRSFTITKEMIRKSIFFNILLAWLGFFISYFILKLLFEYFHFLPKFEWVCFIVSLIFGFSIKDLFSTKSKE
jgi:hypothetical protein